MRLLSRYIAREYARVALFTFAAMGLLYVSAHFLGRLDEFIQYRAAPSLVGTLILLSLPRVFYEILPLGILVSTLVTLGLLARSNEITAMRALGLGPARLAGPLLAVAAVLVAVGLADAEWGIPAAERRAAYLDDVALKKRAPIRALRRNRIWFRPGPNRLCTIEKVDADTPRLHNVTLWVLDPRFRPLQRIDAPEVTWRKGRWIPSGGKRWRFGPDGEIRSEEALAGPFPLDLPLDQIVEIEKRPREMGFEELSDYIRLLRRNGYPTRTYEVDLHAKAAYPALGLVMALFAFPLALRRNRAGGTAAGVALGVAVGCACWAAYALGLSLGHAGVLPPPAAAWGTGGIFAAAAAALLRRLPY